MGIFGKILLGLLAIIVLAVILDVLTWIYEVAWVIPIIIVLLIGVIVWKTSLPRKKMRIRKLVNASLVDGKITDREKQTIIRKAMLMGMDAGEAEIYMEESIHKLTGKTNKR